MSDEIKPALTPEEWEDVRLRDGCTLLSVVSDIGAFPDLAPAAMAVANHALPNGHPLKITREDVDQVEEVCAMYDRERYQHMWAVLERLSAKLAALLPPEA